MRILSFIKTTVIVLVLFASCTPKSTENITNGIDLSVNNWYIWLDNSAEWVNDELYLPPVNIEQIPENPPTIGWDELMKQKGTKTKLPATVEEYFWQNNGNERGIAGNYTGVSWFYTTMDIPSAWEGKNIFIDFESVRVRAEIFINRQLVGYDLINGTPFSVNITENVKLGQMNEIAVRITDPNGNFAWRDWDSFYWGDKLIPPSHGFGGITGKVELRATDNSYLEDIFIKNRPEITTIDIEFYIDAFKNQNPGGVINYQISKKGSETKVKTGEIKVSPFSGISKVSENISIPDGEIWDVDNPNLYELSATWTSENGDKDQKNETFGLRWFNVKEIDGDKMFFLNNKRIVLRSAISWGHWPINGIYPTTELAKKHIESAKAFGLNMLHFHRGIGQTMVLNYADELGLTYYQEPGGYKPDDSELIQGWKREKWLRMIKRDRNHPSLVIYNMINESTREPFEHELQDLKDAHKIDETRLKTFTSTHFTPKFYDRNCPKGPAPFKSHMYPYEHEIRNNGWWDEHHAGGPGVYADDFYNGPDDIFRHYDIPEEIVMLGEDGAVGTLPRLQLINNEVKNLTYKGWDGKFYMEQFSAFDKFIKEHGFSDAFPTVDDLTKSIGVNSHYYQGRIIENFRIGNTGDGYVINGWEDTKIENHSGIVDVFRNPKTDPSILAYYNQALYVAVKLRKKVIETGESTIADFYIINEKDLSGNFDLKVKVSDKTGIIKEQTIPVTISGGNTYGELLYSDMEITATNDGYTIISAEILKNTEIAAKGEDQIFSVSIDGSNINKKIVVADKDEAVQSMLDKLPGISYEEYNPQNRRPNGNVVIVGRAFQPGFTAGNFRMDCPVMDWVSEGNTMIVVSGAKEVWAQYLEHKEVIEYRGFRNIGRDWFGGNYFVKEHPLFDGLPVNTAFHWEYQALNRYSCDRYGLRLIDGECVAGVYADHKTEVYSAVSIIPVGKGCVILSTLDLAGAINSDISSAVVAKRILLNYIKYTHNDQTR